jgi:hypothetical protein
MVQTARRLRIGNAWRRFGPVSILPCGVSTELCGPRAGRGRDCQELGEKLWREGWAGVVTRSAARPEAFVVCIRRHVTA